MARVEQDLMLGFYAVRKLIEASKLADTIAQQSISLTMYPPTGKPVTRLNWHRLDELFDFGQPQMERWKLIDVCHQFVHSYVFAPSTADSGSLDGFHIASDRQRGTGLLYLHLNEVIRVFREVGNDYPTYVKMEWDPKKGDYQVTSKTDPSLLRDGPEVDP
jgi:hypothetical protein